MLFESISKETKRFEKAYRDTLRLGNQVGENPELQAKLDQFRQHLGRVASDARLADWDRKYGRKAIPEEELFKNPILTSALEQDRSGDLKGALKGFTEIIRSLPPVIARVVHAALVFGVTELYRATHGQDPQMPAQVQRASAEQPKPSIDAGVMAAIRKSPDFDVPAHTRTVKDWTDYLQGERQSAQQGTFLRQSGMEPVPESGFVVVDVPTQGAARVFNFRTEEEVIAAADATGAKWRSQGWHPVTAIGQALIDLGGRQRVGLHRSWEEAVAESLKPENAHSREAVLGQIRQLQRQASVRTSSPDVQVGAESAIPAAQKEDLLKAMRILSQVDDGAQAKDGRGFRADHVSIGTKLAGKSVLTDAEAEVARDLVLFYSRQIKESDVELLHRALGGRPRGQVDLDQSTLTDRLQWSETKTGLSQADAGNVSIPKRVPIAPMMERAEVIQVGVKRSGGIGL